MPAPIAFPLAKLGVLLVKQISKPISRRIAKTANQSEVFRNWICIPIGQLFHRVEVKIKRASMDLPFNVPVDQSVLKVRRLSEKQAVDQGSEIISEVLILSVAIGVIVYEFSRSQEEKREEEEMKTMERLVLKQKLYDMEVNVDKHHDYISSVARSLSQSCDKMLGSNCESTKLVKEIIKDNDSAPRSKVEPLNFVEDGSSKKLKTKPSDEDEEEKSLTDEIVEFVEEVVEEVLEVVNPDDDD